MQQENEAPKAPNLGAMLRKVTAPLPVCFGAAAKEALNGELLETFEREESAKARLDEAKADYKSRSTAIADRQRDLRTKLRAGYERQDVLTAVYLDVDDPDMAYVIRLDTGAVVRHRPATDREKQMPLPSLEPDEVEDGAGNLVEPPTGVPDSPELPVIDADFIETNSAPFLMGKDAHRDRLAGAPEEETSNPFAPGSVEHIAWDEGFKTAAEAKPQTNDEKLAAELAKMSPGQREAFFEDLPVGEVRPLHALIVGVAPGRKRATTLVIEILAKLKESDDE